VRVATLDRLNEVRLAVENAGRGLMDEGRVHRIVIDTYEREIERYGGAEAIDLAEQLFWADSDAAIDLLRAIGSTGEAAHARWQLAAASVDRLLEDFDLDLDGRAELMHGLRERFGRELQVGGSLRRQLAAKYRQIREDLITLLEGSVEPDHPMGIALTAFAGRSSAARRVAQGLRALAHEGRLTTPITRIVESHVHMTLNRIFRADHRRHELVIYDFLTQVYRQRQARRMTV
jgi:class I lanthipeptide synthase